MATNTKTKDSTKPRKGDETKAQLAKIISDITMWKQPPFSSEEEFAQRCNEYMALIEAKGESYPTCEAFALYLGTSYHKLRKWSKGEDCPEARKDKVQEVITWACAIWTEAMTQQVIGATPYIWYSKQWFDMKEPDTRLTLDAITPLKELQSAESVKLKYLTDLEETNKKPKKLTE